MGETADKMREVNECRIEQKWLPQNATALKIKRSARRCCVPVARVQHRPERSGDRCVPVARVQHRPERSGDRRVPVARVWRRPERSGDRTSLKPEGLVKKTAGIYGCLSYDVHERIRTSDPTLRSKTFTSKHKKG